MKNSFIEKLNDFEKYRNNTNLGVSLMVLKFKTFIQNNKHWILSGIVIACLLIYAFGCEPQTRSLVHPERKVDRLQLTFEIETLLMRSEAGFADLDRQIEIRNLIFQQGLIAVQGGTLNPVGIITTIMAVFGIGLAGDDLRLRRKIKKNSE